MEGGGGREEPHSEETQHHSPLQCHFKQPDKSQRRKQGKSTPRSSSENHPVFQSAAGRSHPGITIASLLSEN